MTELVLTSVDATNGVAVITLNRRTASNALNNELMAALLEAVRRCASDEDVRAVVLTGAGDKAFAAGADLDELMDRDHRTETGPSSSRRREITRLLETMPKPTIAAINGHALGGGLELALACDIRLVSPHAKVGLPEINLGIIPGNGGTQRTVRMIGLARALELVLTGDPIDAHRASEIGLVNRVVPSGDLMDEAVALAAALAAKPPRAMAAAKETVRLAQDLPADAGLAYENKWFAVLCGSPEKDEAVRRLRGGARSGGPSTAEGRQGGT